MADYMNMFRDWASTLREDVETLKRVVEADGADEQGRRYAGAALNYLLTRMDLVPDWEETIGILDDVLVLRALADLAVQRGVDEVVDSETAVELARLMNEVEKGHAWLGDELWSKFSKHTETLVDKSVRGRSPGTLIDDRDARAAAWAELEEHIKSLPAHSFADEESVEIRFKSYIQHKLK
jgi:uncharacterized membrane protein YkvA (DUF1232 family)